jgi:predicted esterase
MRELNVPVTTHGRILIDEPFDSARDGAANVAQDRPFDSAQDRGLRLLVGCHGYAQNAGEMMAMLRGIPTASGWTRVSVQALHRFYRGRSQITVASWMTSEDRELMIRDNVAYLDAAIAGVAGDRAIERLVYFGFSQGVAMAFRAGLRGARKADAVLALGGDVPRELLADAALTFPEVLLARGTRDEWYSAAKLEADEAALRSRGARVDTLTFDGAHEWHPDVATRAAAVLSSGL